MKVEKYSIKKLLKDPSNARKHSPKNLDAIKGSLAKFGQQKPIVVGKDNVVLAGNGTLAAAIDLGWKEIDIVRTSLVGSDAVAYAIADNRTGELAEWDIDALTKTLIALNEEFDLSEIGFDDDDLKDILGQASGDGEKVDSATLSDRFVVPPFSVLDARQGYWQERKRQWLAMGMKSELGRGGA